MAHEASVTMAATPVGAPGFEVWGGRLSPVTLVVTSDPHVVEIVEKGFALARLGLSVAWTRAEALAIARAQLAARRGEARRILAEVERLAAGLRDD